MTILTLSIDPGNAYLKAVRRGIDGKAALVTFPNQVALDSDNLFHDFAGFMSSDPLVVEADGQQWAVGEDAEKLSRTPRARVGYAKYDSPEFKILLAAGLGEAYPVHGGKVSLAFSLPVDAFGQAGKVKAQLAGEWAFRCRKRNLRFELDPDLMMVVPETFGSLAYFLLDESGTGFANLDLAEWRVAAIDVGGYTTQTVSLDGLELGRVRGSVERGVLQVMADVNKALKRKFNRHDLSRADLEGIVKTGQYWHRGKQENVADIVESAVYELARGVMDFYADPQGLAGGVDYRALIVTGGGWPIVGEYVKEMMSRQDLWHHNVLAVRDEHAAAANALGIWRYITYVRTYQQER